MSSGAPGRENFERERARLISAYQPLVASVVARFGHLEVPREDLVQEGMIGLIKAIDNFDAGRGVPLRVYASRLIAGHIQHFLRDRVGLIRGRRRGEVAEIPEVTSLEDPGPPHGETRKKPAAAEQALITDGGLGEAFFLRHALSRLGFLQREALQMRFLDRLGPEEIAAALALGPRVVEALIEDACLQLANELGMEPPAQPATGFDPASGLLSRAAFMRRANEELEAARRQGGVFSVALLELGVFPAPDLLPDHRMLRRTGELLHSHIRRGDSAGRLAARTFGIALPHAGPRGATAMLCRVMGVLCPKVPRQALRTAAASYPADGPDLEDLLGAAAKRLEPALARAA